jgi:hypothetical protein
MKEGQLVTRVIVAQLLQNQDLPIFARKVKSFYAF